MLVHGGLICYCLCPPIWKNDWNSAVSIDDIVKGGSTSILLHLGKMTGIVPSVLTTLETNADGFPIKVPPQFS